MRGGFIEKMGLDKAIKKKKKRLGDGTKDKIDGHENYIAIERVHISHEIREKYK
jgi:hypothetical protein